MSEHGKGVAAAASLWPGFTRLKKVGSYHAHHFSSERSKIVVLGASEGDRAKTHPSGPKKGKTERTPLSAFPAQMSQPGQQSPKATSNLLAQLSKHQPPLAGFPKQAMLTLPGDPHDPRFHPFKIPAPTTAHPIPQPFPTSPTNVLAPPCDCTLTAAVPDLRPQPPASYRTIQPDALAATPARLVRGLAPLHRGAAGGAVGRGRQRRDFLRR